MSTTTTIATKDQERDALAKIKKIVEGLGPQSYLATAFEGCFHDAEDNIENDFAFSMASRYTQITELTAEVVHEFIEKVFVGEAEYTEPRFGHWAREKKQEVRIIYNYLGDVSGTIKEE